MLMALIFTTIFFLVLIFAGVEEYKARREELDKKEYPFLRFMPLGYGALKLMRARNFSEDKIYKIYHMRYNNVTKASTVYLDYVAHTITVSLTVFIVVAFMSVILAFRSADAQTVMRLMLTGSAMSIAMSFGYRSREIKKDKQRRADIVDELPVVLSKLMVLVGSGMPMPSAILSIGKEKREGKANPLYEELSDIALAVENGTKSIWDALNDMQLRCRIAQVSKFVTAVNQQISTGGVQDNHSLSVIAHELWIEKKSNARKRCGVIKAKLQIPTFIVFGAVMLLTSMSGFAVLAM